MSRKTLPTVEKSCRCEPPGGYRRDVRETGGRVFGAGWKQKGLTRLKSGELGNRGICRTGSRTQAIKSLPTFNEQKNMITCYVQRNSKNPDSRYKWETVTGDGNPWYRQVFEARSEARKFAIIFNFTQDFKKAGTAFAGCYPLDCKAQHWYDILLNGRPESTILSHTPELALSEALNAGLKIGRSRVAVAQRLSDD